jgi:hypothetical protein
MIIKPKNQLDALLNTLEVAGECTLDLNKRGDSDEVTGGMRIPAMRLWSALVEISNRLDELEEKEK